MGIKDRLYDFLKVKDLNASKFEQACGLGNGFCGKVNDNITEGSLSLIKKAFPELNINWLKTGFGDMLIEDFFLENSNDGVNMVAMMKMMHEFIQLNKKNSDANLINAEANKLNAQNLERLIGIIENKFD